LANDDTDVIGELSGMQQRIRTIRSPSFAENEPSREE
jgi:hypothetical protein